MIRRDRIPHVIVVRVSSLRDVLAYLGWTIDDVVNNPLVKRQVLGYFKTRRHIHRECERIDLERQWSKPSRKTTGRN